MVAIKDMEMPKNCAECKLFHFYFDLNWGKHYVCKYGNIEIYGDLKNKRNDFCPLIEEVKEEALEQTELNPSYNGVKTELKPCDDYISRTELLARIDAERKHLLDLKMDGAEHIIVHHARRIIEDMPSVRPKIESEVKNDQP